MIDLVLAAGGAAWLGVLTAVSPCLMACNVTAITFIARRVGNPRHAFISGLFYVAGQALAYVVLAALLVTSLLSVPLVSQWLQEYMIALLGPILILASIFLFELIDVQFGSGKMKQWIQDRVGVYGFWAAALLGIVFAMSFCPTTAALFFGSLIPLAVTHESPLVLPLAYAGGVALPVLVFGVLIAFAADRVSATFERIGRVERWARYATGGVFLTAGLFFTLRYTIGVL